MNKRQRMVVSKRRAHDLRSKRQTLFAHPYGKSRRWPAKEIPKPRQRDHERSNFNFFASHCPGRLRTQSGGNRRGGGEDEVYPTVYILAYAFRPLFPESKRLDI